jgi:ATP-dependent exoDNAse (exonuclease V) beta subunit
MIPPASEEQKNIVANYKENNIKVDAVAGSGKTTTVYYIGTEYSNDPILLLTYNKKLRLETRKKLEENGVTNVEVHTYHSFCVKYYNHKCFTDRPMKTLIDKNKKPLKPFNYKRIICDEAQDITPLYYRLIHKIYKDNEFDNVLKCIMGDEKQSIYGFNGADERFITKAEILFKTDETPWINCNLSTSFRITKQMADFINKGCLQKERISSQKEGVKPIYLKCDVYENQFKLKCKSKIFRILEKLLQTYEPGEIFILAPSIKSEKTPVRVLENKLKTILPDINIFIPTSDEEKIDEDVIKGKIVFSTFHQSKGLERKVVLVYNADDSYFSFYKQNIDPRLFVNELYVAFTRASERLVLIQNESNIPLQFLDERVVRKLTTYMDSEMNGRRIRLKKNKLIKTAVTDITRHLKDEVIDEIMKYFIIEKIRKESQKINIDNQTNQINTIENVSEITGTAVPIYYESLIKGKIDCIRSLPRDENKTQHNNMKEFGLIEDSMVEERKETKNYDIKKIDIHELLNNPDELLYIANRWCSYKSGFLAKIKQITVYDWLSQENLERCKNRIDTLELTKNVDFEKKYQIGGQKELFNRELIGFIDCKDKNNIYEFKCVNKLEPEHFIQLAIYAYMNEMECRQFQMMFNYYLYNILTDEMFRIDVEFGKLKEMMEYIIYKKYFSDSEKLPDEIFIKNMIDLIV